MPASSRASTRNIWPTPIRWIATWRDFFAALGEQGLTPTQLGRGPAWRRDAKPARNGELTSALTGDWPAPKQPQPAAPQPPPPAARSDAARHSIRAVQMIRAYRMHRPSRSRSRSARARRRAQPHPQLDPVVLRLSRRRPGPPDLHRRRAGPRHRHAAPDAGHPAAHLLRPHRL